MHSDRKNKIFLNYSIYFVGILNENRPLVYPDTINAVFYKQTFILSEYMKIKRIIYLCKEYGSNAAT